MEAGVCRAWSGRMGLPETARASITTEDKTILIKNQDDALLYLVNQQKNQEQSLKETQQWPGFSKRELGVCAR